MAQIVGQVSSTGSVNIGVRLITAGRESKGVYAVRYDEPFDTEPVVVVTALADRGSTSGVSISDSTSNGFTVSIKTMGGELIDRGFNLIAATN